MFLLVCFWKVTISSVTLSKTICLGHRPFQGITGQFTVLQDKASKPVPCSSHKKGGKDRVEGGGCPMQDTPQSLDLRDQYPVPANSQRTGVS